MFSMSWCSRIFKASFNMCHSKNGAILVAQSVRNLSAMQEAWVDPWVGKIPWRRKWQLAPVFLPGEVHGQRRLVGYSPWVTKSRT